ncbi:MAG TPA: S24/S26 family peptidase [bacterium]|nr:S24/S26 family peptidase [bacterium]HPR89513.1 S24/S26 family peptidase [bacterium]
MSDPAPQILPNHGFADLMTAVLEKGKPFRFQAAGASMAPFIRNGDVITIAPVVGRISIGEVLAFRRPDGGKLAVHRVVARSRQGLLLKGDNSCQSDGWVTPDSILGRVSRIEHRGHQVRIGLGPERHIIAWLSRRALLRPLLVPVSRLLRPVYKRFFV